MKYIAVEDGIVTAWLELSGEVNDPRYIEESKVNFNGLTPDEFVGGPLLENNTVSLANVVEDVPMEVSERQWRDGELQIVVALTNEPNHPYKAQLEVYLQELRDYPASEGFATGTRPIRPLTPSGSPIILG